MATKRLPMALAALFLFQFLHGLAPAPDDAPEEGGVTGLIGGAAFLLATAVAWYWARRGEERGRRLGRLLGVAIPVAFVLYHGAWFTSPVTNPYWGDGSATVWQWVSLPLVMAAGVVSAALAAPRRREREALAAP